MEYPDVLVATPTYVGKEYALKAYAKAFKRFKYPGRTELLLVDNTPGTRAYADLCFKVTGQTVMHMEPHDEFGTTHYCALKMIHEYAMQHEFPLILSLEQDVIIPPTGLKKMVRRLQKNGLCVLAQEYLPRPSTGYSGWQAEMGCTLVRWDDMQATFDGVVAHHEGADVHEPHNCGVNFADTMMEVAHDYEIVNLFDAKHLEGDHGPWTFKGEDPRYRAGASATVVKHINPGLTLGEAL